MPIAVIEGPGPIAALAAVIVALLLVDLLLFARGREPTFRDGVIWSIGWFVMSLLVALPVMWLDGNEAAVNYLTVYLIERSLSLDNLFVFLLLFSYFAIPSERRPILLFWGIVAALVLRGLAILGGTALIEEFHFVIYVLGATLLVLAYRMFRGVGEHVDPEQSIVVRGVRRVFPHASTFTLAIASIVAADIAFAVDSIPAAFAITTDAFAIWTANAFALLGLRALFVLVEGLIRRFRYLDETIAIVLGIVAIKLLIEDLVKISPAASLAMVGLAFTIGIVASIVADRRDPDAAVKQAQRAEALDAATHPERHPDDHAGPPA
jgi:tellurite resistance protein TerC